MDGGYGVGGQGGETGGRGGGVADVVDVNVLCRINYADKASHVQAIPSLMEEKELIQEKLEQTVRHSDRWVLELQIIGDEVGGTYFEIHQMHLNNEREG